MTIDRRSPWRSGFTLIELLVVIGIMLVLMAILLPVVSKVRIAANDSATQQEMERIFTACESYYHDFNSYPGPIANTDLSGGTGTDTNYVLPTNITGGNGKVTSSENLVLGLFGMLNPPTTSGGAITFLSPSPTASNPSPTPPHDPLSLNYLHPQSYHYLDFVPTELSVQTGFSKDLEYAQGQAPTDTNVPEFIDLFAQPMPILYMRADTGATGTEGSTDSGNQYNYMELQDYGSDIPLSTGAGQWTMFGTGTYFTTTLNNLYNNGTGTLADSVATPYTDWGYTGTTAPAGGYYLMNSNLAGAVRGKDGFILIGAGKDRVYGTADDTIITP